MKEFNDEEGLGLCGGWGDEEEVRVYEREEQRGRLDIWQVDQGGSRSGMFEVQRDESPGIGRARAVDMFKDWFTSDV